MQWITIEDTGILLPVDYPMAKRKVNLDECEPCRYHGGKKQATSP